MSLHTATTCGACVSHTQSVAANIVQRAPHQLLDSCRFAQILLTFVCLLCICCAQAEEPKAEEAEVEAEAPKKKAPKRKAAKMEGPAKRAKKAAPKKAAAKKA